MRAAEIRAALGAPWVHGEALDLAGLTLDEPLDLDGCVLCGVDFSGARFLAPVSARGARFEGLSWFTGATFAQADFSGALFVNDARFEESRFGTAPDFHGAEFRGIARFGGATLPGGDFRALTCYGNADFGGTDAGALDLAGSEFLGGFWAQSARFGAGARFDETQVHGRLWLRGATRGNAALAPEAFTLAFGYSWV